MSKQWGRTSVRIRAGVLALAVISAIAGLGVVAGASYATATSGGTVTMISQQGDWVGQGQSRLWSTPTDAVTATGSGSGVAVSVSGSSGDFSLELLSPNGRPLVPGAYPNAQRWPFQSAGHAGLDVSGDGRGCNEVSGRFWVLDISSDRSRVWVDYEEHCEGGTPAVFGEIKIGEPDTGTVRVSPSQVRWPDGYPHAAIRPVPVHVANTGSSPLKVSSATIAAGATDFSVLDNTCGTVAVGGECTVYVGITPSISGDRLGELRLATTAGTRWVPLAGHGFSGLTSWKMSSDPGDFIGAGQSYSYSPAKGAQISASGNESLISAHVTQGDHSWTADFEAPDGSLLLPGTTFSPTARYPFNSGVAGLDVTGDGRGCNESNGSFTVKQATYRNDGSVSSFLIRFTQHCEHAAPALHGTIAWHAKDPNAPARDHTAPHAVRDLTHHWTTPRPLKLTWKNPRDTDWVDTRIRVLPGRTAPATPDDGREVYTGRGHSASIALSTGHARYTVGIFTRDTSGNVHRVALTVHPH